MDTYFRLEYLLREEWSMKHIKLPIYLDKAIELGLASLDDNTFRHPHTGEVNVQVECLKTILMY